MEFHSVFVWLFLQRSGPRSLASAVWRPWGGSRPSQASTSTMPLTANWLQVRYLHPCVYCEPVCLQDTLTALTPGPMYMMSGDLRTDTQHIYLGYPLDSGTNRSLTEVNDRGWMSSLPISGVSQERAGVGG
jgi:hypothetical protein